MCAHVSVNVQFQCCVIIEAFNSVVVVCSAIVLLVCSDIFCGKALILLCTHLAYVLNSSESGRYKDQWWWSDLR